MTSIRFYAPEQIGKRRSRTPEGFLLIEATPICRTGLQIYGPDETPVEPSPGRDFVRVWRRDKEVFRPETMASANGKSLVNDHPDEDVNPQNWKELSGGVFMNPKQGVGAESDLLLADLLVTDAGFIDLIEGGKVELSCGYDADYIDLDDKSEADGEQTSIIINHVALVDSGRCGPRCAIGDHATTHHRGNLMSNIKDLTDKIRQAFKARDTKKLDEALSEAEKSVGELSTAGGEGEDNAGGHHVHVHLGGADRAKDGEGEGESGWAERFQKLEGAADQISARLDSMEEEMGGMNEDARRRLRDKRGYKDEAEKKAEMDRRSEHDAKMAKDNKEIEGELEEEEPEGTGDKGRRDKAKDSAGLASVFQSTLALAEILAPGIQVPTFDATAKGIDTSDVLCKLRRRALDLAVNRDETRAIVEAVLAGKTFDANTKCSEVRTMFNAAGTAARALNSQRAAGGTQDRGGSYTSAGPMTLAELNARNAERWARK